MKTNKKEKMDPFKKTKLIFLGEYILISLVFLVLIILKLTDVLKSDNFIKSTIFNIVTLLGGIWLISDFIWATFSKKRRPKISYLDKCLHLPIGIYLIIFDIISLINWNASNYIGVSSYNWFKYGIVIVFIYIVIDYSFEGIYHYFYPIPEMLKMAEEMKKEEEEKNQKEIDESIKDSSDK